MTNDKIDPRFNPAFQRGYQGAIEHVPTQTQRQSVLAPAPQAEPHRSSGNQSAQSAEPRIGVRPVEPEVHEPEEASEPETDRRTGLNPFMIVLLAIGAGLIGFGAFMFQAARQEFLTSSISDFVTVQTVTFAAPLSIALGAATIIGVLFMLAIGWGRSR